MIDREAALRLLATMWQIRHFEERVGRLKRADEVVNVDGTVEELRTRLRQGKIYKPEKIEQALTNFFRIGNLSTLRELALRTAVMNVVGARPQK